MSRIADRIGRWSVWPMLRKEFVQMRRDRFTLGMMIGLPAVQLVLFGYAIRTEVRDLPTLVLDESRTSESRALIATLENTGNFAILDHVRSRAEIAERVGRGEARAAIVIPPNYASEVKRGRTARAQVIVDAADPMASSAAISWAAMAGQARSLELLAARGMQVRAPLELRVRPWYNPALETSTYIVPGIVGVLLTLTMVLITSMSIVRERERGTLEQLVVTPIDKTSLMLGKILPFVLVGYVQMSVVLGLGKLLFDIPVRGSLTALYGIAFAFIVASLGVGLFLSTLVRTQAQAIQLGFFFLLPNILLSGFMFPREAMPEAAQWIGAALPLTYFLEVLRGVLLRGVGLDALWREALMLILFSILLVAFSVRKFRKTLE